MCMGGQIAGTSIDIRGSPGQFSPVDSIQGAGSVGRGGVGKATWSGEQPPGTDLLLRQLSLPVVVFI